MVSRWGILWSDSETALTKLLERGDLKFGMCKTLRDFLKDESGATAIEYELMPPACRSPSSPLSMAGARSSRPFSVRSLVS
jgi:hypothetical protein